MKWNVWNITTQQWASYKSVRSRAGAEAVMLGHLAEAKRKRQKHQFEIRQVLPMMEQHGTTLMKLRPSMICRVAMDDFARRAHNLQADVTGMRPYAFHRKHVVKAESANDILRNAIADPERGRNSSKRDTRLLYADVELLKAALR